MTLALGDAEENSMAKKKYRFRAARPLLISFAAVAGLALSGCPDDDPGYDDEPVPLDVQNACNTYCERVVDCDDSRDLQDCRDRCYDAMGACMASEQAQALAELEACADQSCNDLLACSIAVSATCVFGL